MAVLLPEPDRPVTTTTSRLALTDSPPCRSKLLILLADEAEELGAVAGGDQFVAKPAILEQARHTRQRLQMLADRILGGDQQKEQVGRAAVERIEIDPASMAAKRTDDPLQAGHLAVRDGDAVADRRAAEPLPVPQHFDEAL